MKRKDFKLRKERLENMLINVIGNVVNIINIIPLDDGLYVRYSDHNLETVEDVIGYEKIIEFYKIQLTAEALFRKLNPQ